MSSLFVGHPLDTIKVRLQSSQASGKYSGTLNAFKTIVREERVRGLYKGVTSPLVGPLCGVWGGWTWGLMHMSISLGALPKGRNRVSQRHSVCIIWIIYSFSATERPKSRQGAFANSDRTRWSRKWRCRVVSTSLWRTPSQH